MKFALIPVLLFAVATSSTARADDLTGHSPSGKLAYTIKNQKEFYVWEIAAPQKQVLLYKEEDVFVQAATISPDDLWIALEHGGSSLGHTILFLKRQSGLDFKLFGEANTPDPAEQAGALALQSEGIKENILDHSYLHPVKWSDDSKWLTMALDAKGVANGKRIQISNWHCRYNPTARAVAAVKDNPGKIEITKSE